MTDRDIDEGAVVVRAWAPWCSSCAAMAPVVADVADAAAARVVDVQVDRHPDLVQRFGLRSVPQLIALRDGIEVGRLVGSQSRTSVERLFAAAADPDAEKRAVRGGAPPGLIIARLAAGVALTVVGLLTATLALVVSGALVATWGAAGLVRLATRA
jgi:thiol-disulfide isomerase/thioredoxin